MKKLISLLKACMSSNMQLFKIKSKSEKKSSKIVLPIVLFIICSFSVWSYANMIMEPLSKANLEYVALTLFVLVSFMLTLVEGIYKSGGLLFNTKDDNLLFSLPIKKSTILFVRIFKFYLFEVVYNALFMLPAMVAYIRYGNVGVSYYIVSLLMLLLLPIIPIVISSVIGFISAYSSSKFKYKNIAQIIIVMIFTLSMLYVSFNIDNLVEDLVINANKINGFITKLYYPAAAYIRLVRDFNILELFKFILINVLLFGGSILLLSKFYFKINSNVKSVSISHNNGKYKIKQNSVIKSIIKKELNRIINTPVFVANATFGLVLFLIGSILLVVKFDSIAASLINEESLITVSTIKSYIPIVIFILIVASSFTSSMTCSMISLEGRSFNILKSLPVKPFKIILAKVLTTVLISFSFLLVGDIILFIRFNLNIFEMLLLIMCSIVYPLISSLVGIIANLKYPKMDADNDTEVVKQSMSSFIAVMLGFALIGINAGIMVLILALTSIDISILGTLLVGIILCVILISYLKNKGTKIFNEINA